MASNVSRLIREATADDAIPVVVSHPSNAFYGHHHLFAEQANMPLVSLQDLNTKNGRLFLGGDRVGSIVKLFSTNTLMDRSVVSEELYNAVVNGEINIFNGLLTPFMGDKLYLKYIVDNQPGLAEFVPEMKSLPLGSSLDLKSFENWWLKADARRRLELTVNLNKDDTRGWPGKVLQAMVLGDFDSAYSYLEGRETPTALRYREYLDGVREEKVGMFLLQKNIPSTKVWVTEGGKETEVNTLLRAYFVPKELSTDEVDVYFELLAGRGLRVSLAGFGIPVK